VGRGETDTRAPNSIPQGKNLRWSRDFVSDALSDGRLFPVLVIVDDVTREMALVNVKVDLHSNCRKD
jgi:hypothetical protein